MNLKLKQSQSPAKTIPPKNMTGYMKTHINMYFRSLYIVYFDYESTVKFTGYKPRPNSPVAQDPVQFTKELNSFYAWFDTLNFSTNCERWLETLQPPFPEDPAPFAEEEAWWQLSQCKLGKGPGPDNITGRVLKSCARELSPIIHRLFCKSYHTTTIPTLWKTATIIPIPKKPRPTEHYHYRPIALTCVLMKCLEKLTLKAIMSFATPQLDSLQIAYKARRETEDAVSYLLHTSLQHLDSQGHFARILFIDFSSVFSTIQRHLMIQKLHHLNIPVQLIHLIHNFLSNRPQALWVGSTTSPTLTTNTGAPQGCVLSPFLYTLYTRHGQTMARGPHPTRCVSLSSPREASHKSTPPMKLCPHVTLPTR